MGKRSEIWSIAFFLILFAGALTLTFSWHPKHDQFTRKGTIWADKAGYYIYLPATFLYQFDPKKAPQDIDKQTGSGFMIDLENQTVGTKYTCGVAVLLSPFFLLAHGISLVFNLPEQGGFSPLYHAMVNIAAVCYLIVGLMLLRIVLAKYFSQLTQYVSILFIFIGTNLLYYAVEDTLMSHVYSFFLFSLFLFSAQKFWEKNAYKYFFLIALSGSLAILIRPTNVILFAVFFFWDLAGWRDLLKRIKVFVTPKYLITFILVLFLVLLPQFIYWKYLHDSYLFYTYGDEGFTNLAYPKLFEVWFAPLNGLILYSPSVLVILVGMVFMIWRRNRNGWFFLILFLLLSYECASWQTWYFGCSFGQRSFVEYYAIFIIPFAFLIESVINQRSRILKTVVLLLLVAFSCYNIQMTSIDNKCFFGSTWDWNSYLRQLDRAGIPFTSSSVISYLNDFENQALIEDEIVSREIVRSGMYSATFDEEHEYCCKAIKYIRDFPQDNLPKMVKVSAWVFYPDSVFSGATLVFSVEQEGNSLKWEGIDLTNMITTSNSWQQVSTSFTIPEKIAGDTKLLIYFWNPVKCSIFIDNLEVRYE